MNTFVIGAATSNTSSRASTFRAAAVAVRLRQCTGPAEARLAAAGRHLRRTVRCRKEALEHRLQELVLELLAAIVLVAIFMVVTEPATREDC